MSFEKILRIPSDRIGVLIGKSGNVKVRIENTCTVSIYIDSQSGETVIRSAGSIEDIRPFKAVEIVTAIARGFSPENAMKLLEGDNRLHIIDLREFAGKSNSAIERIKGRIIGEEGKARRNMENLSGTIISVYGKTVSIIGETTKLKIVVDAIASLSSGSMHGTVYSKLENANRRRKLDKLNLWEDRNVFY